MPVLLLLCSAGYTPAGETQTNLQLIEKSLQAVVQEMEPNLALKDSSALAFTSAAGGVAWDWLIEKALYDVLGAKHHIILRRIDSASASAEMPLLFYAPLEMKIRYQPNKESGRPIVRHLFCRLYVRYQDELGRIIFAREMEHSIVDSLANKNFASIENQAYAFTVGERSPSSLLKRMAEPLMLTAITGGIIYLFYAFRSN